MKNNFTQDESPACTRAAKVKGDLIASDLIYRNVKFRVGDMFLAKL